MIPMIGLLLCCYLVFKGVEIFQIYRCSPRTDNTAAVIAVLALIASVAIAALFALAFLSSSIPSSLPR